MHFGRPGSGSCPRGRRRRLLHGAVGFVLLAAAMAQADSPRTDSPRVFFQGGRPVPLLISPDEVCVECRPQVAAAEARRTLAAFGETIRLPGFADLGHRVPLRLRETASAAAIGALPGVRAVHPVYRVAPDGPPLIPTGEIVVALRADAGPGAIQAVAQDWGLEVVRSLGGLTNTWVLRPLRLGADVAALAAAIHTDDRVRYCHPDFITPIERAAIDDPLYPDQWHLNNTGQGGGTVDADIDAPEAWTLTEGLGSAVAILDDSHETTHPDLVGGLIAAWDFTENDDDPFIPIFTHGTRVSGVAVGQANTIGVRGVAPRAGWIAMRWGGFTGVADSFTFADTNGAAVHSNSWRYSDGSLLPDVVVDAIRNAVSNGRGGLGMPVVFAAANDASTIPVKSALAALPETIAVGASDFQDGAPRYPNVGAELDICAPSSGDSGSALKITTTTTTGDGSYTNQFGQTSAATPQVAGIIALMDAANPNLTAGQMRRILEHTAQPFAPGISDPDVVTGHSNRKGYGRANAEQAVLAALDAANNGGHTWPPPVADFQAVDGANAIDLTWTNPTEEFAGVLIVASTAPVQWAPTDGQTYSLGEQVAPDTEVVYIGTDAMFTHSAAPGDHHYAAFTFNAINRYGWGRRASATISTTAFLSDSFDPEPADGWTHFGTADSWEFGAPNYYAGPDSAHSGTSVFGTNLSGMYASGGSSNAQPVATLRSPLVSLATARQAYVVFWDWLSIIGGGTDYGQVNLVDEQGTVLATLIDNYEDSHSQWQRHVLDISEWVGLSVQIEFVLYADNAGTAPGWYIDDFAVHIIEDIAGDFDGDGDVDIADFSTFTACFSGSGNPPPPGCEPADLDGDGDVDIADFSTFSANFTGSQ